MASCCSRRIQAVPRLCMWRARAMSSPASNSPRTYTDAGKIISASIASVSPLELVHKALSFDTSSNLLSVAGHAYPIDHNVKVVAFGKAVLGMVSAVEGILGEHIVEGVASIPVGAMEMAQKCYPHYLPAPSSKTRIYEGAEGNLPDLASEAAAREVLSIARRCGEGDVLIALLSGGGSALLSCPAAGISIEEKRKVVESLAKRGADIQELNSLRKAISQTKGGKLAEAGFPARVLGLVVSDVVGDPLETIASGPTVPQKTEPKVALEILAKYGLLEGNVHSSVCAYLSTVSQSQEEAVVRDGEIFNLIIGSNKMATTSAKDTAIGLGYASYVWSTQLQGHASSLGELYATIHHYLSLMKYQFDKETTSTARTLLYEELHKLTQQYPELEHDILNLTRMIEMVRGGPFCLIGAGEPTVVVRGSGKGGRNQELALAYAIKLDELRERYGGLCTTGELEERDLFVSFGTDGQDGPCDAAGAMVDPLVCVGAREQGLAPAKSLLDHDSYTFFSQLNSGRNLIKSGLTGTNVMDIHVLLMR